MGECEEYDILGNFPFSSETKRMGIILRHRRSSKIMFYLKGAETVMEKKVRPN
jgi:phospholipid-translocating ATPase